MNIFFIYYITRTGIYWYNKSDSSLNLTSCWLQANFALFVLTWYSVWIERLEHLRILPAEMQIFLSDFNESGMNVFSIQKGNSHCSQREVCKYAMLTALRGRYIRT